MSLKSKALAAGVLECLWSCGYESGDDLIGTSDEIERACGWSGKRGTLTPLLLSIGFIDDSTEGYKIHDLFDHAPQYVKRRCERDHKIKVTGQPMASQRLASEQPVKSQPTTTTTTTTSLPTPTPSVETGERVSGFSEFWKSYPRKSGREAALRAWLSVVVNGDASAIMAALAWQIETEEWQREGGRFVPKAENYLFERRWTDEPAKAYVTPDGEPF
jgi:hypothetical protein